MSTICIFHDRQDIQVARLASKAVSALGIEPWTADFHSGGNWRHDVAAALRDPKCIAAIVVWSSAALSNPIVVEEAEEALRARRSVLSLLLEEIDLPIGLRNTPRLILNNAFSDESITTISAKLALVIEAVGQQQKRIQEIVLHDRKLVTPSFVFSVSSFETQISPVRTLELLNLFTPPAILVSAYDVLGTRDSSSDVSPTPCVLADLSSKDTSIFLDSGNYEAYRFRDEFWQRSPWLLREAASRLRCDVVFSHDRIVDADAVAGASTSNYVSTLVADLNRDKNATSRNDISSIIHAPRAPDGSFQSAFLPELCAAVSQAAKPPLIAVAERELGDGILERARRVRSIRKVLDRVGHAQPLHILGTGNPLSMLILAFAGGDIFDGLEWCRTVVDGDTMRLHHFHQFDLFIGQRREIRDDSLRTYLESREEVLTAKAKAVLHNLYFFQRFTEELQEAHRQGAYKELFDHYLPGQFTRISKRLDREAL